MTRDEALAVLGLDAEVDDGVLRRRYRDSIRLVHPDVSGGDDRAAVRLNQAVAVLRSTAAVPPPEAAVEVEAEPWPDDGLVLVASAAEVCARLEAALHQIGTVVDADHDAGRLGVLIGHEGRPPSLLQVALHDGDDLTQAAFTLDSPAGAEAPPIEDIVRHIAHLVRSQT